MISFFFDKECSNCCLLPSYFVVIFVKFCYIYCAPILFIACYFSILLCLLFIFIHIYSYLVLLLVSTFPKLVSLFLLDAPNAILIAVVFTISS